LKIGTNISPFQIPHPLNSMIQFQSQEDADKPGDNEEDLDETQKSRYDLKEPNKVAAQKWRRKKIHIFTTYNLSTIHFVKNATI
jgi:hypothetical protein